jgi:hypothetical protein
MRFAGVVSVAALGVLALASARNLERLHPLPLRAPQKLTAGPLLGFVSGRDATGDQKLFRIDPRSLRPVGSRSIRLAFVDAWSVAPGGKTLALAAHRAPINEPNSLKLVSLPSFQLQSESVRLGGDVSALAWTSPHQVVALVGGILCCPAQLSVVFTNLQTMRVERREPIDGTVLHIARWARGLVLLTGPCGCRKLGSTTVARELPTCATVTQAAVMADARRGHAWFRGLADPLGKLDDRLDQLLPVEQRGVIVVGARDLHDTRLPGSRRRDRAALLRRHNLYAVRHPYASGRRESSIWTDHRSCAHRVEAAAASGQRAARTQEATRPPTTTPATSQETAEPSRSALIAARLRSCCRCM